MLSCLRPIGHLLKAIFLITLPVTFLPFLCGLIEGVFIANFTISSSNEGILYLKQALEAAVYEPLFDTPTSLSVSDTPIPPFHVPRVWIPTNWWRKLGLARFDLGEPEDGDAPEVHDYRVLANLDGLYRKTNGSEWGKPWHHWVYASPEAFHSSSDVLVDEWDNGFQELMQHRYANPAIASASFHYESCPYSYLCATWMVKGPALIHFTTEALDADLEVWTEEEEFNPSYEAVTVRIIELPITDANQLGLPGVFPSPFNQMRILTGESSPWRLFRPYSQYYQFINRVYEHLVACEEAYPKSYGAIGKLGDQVSRFLGFEDSATATAAQFLGICTTALVRLGANNVLSLFNQVVEYNFENPL